MASSPSPFWSVSTEALLSQLDTQVQGLTSREASRRLARYGPNVLLPRRRMGGMALLARQFTNPLILLLIGAAILSWFLQDETNAWIILGIVLVSGLLGFWQERGAADAVSKLLLLVETKARLLRNGQECEVPLEQAVPGDVVKLSAGATVPGDSRILESKDLFANEAALTGESYPVEKSPGMVDPDAPLSARSNTLFLGTHVVSGSALGVVVHTGRQAEIGSIAERLRLRPPETDFERGIRQFGSFLMTVTLILVFLIFAFNVYFKRPVVDSFLFALALAVGLTPQLLPAIISINLARGARRMAEKKVIVRRLEAIENFGSMNVLCSDKTGTLTEGQIRLQSAANLACQDSDKVRLYACLNATFESGFANPIDQAIRESAPADLSDYQRLSEVPYDFERKRLSILVAHGAERLMITKGALANVLRVCTSVEQPDGRVVPLDSVKEEVEEHFEDYSRQGLRTLGIAYRSMNGADSISKHDEQAMTFLGFIVVSDPPKQQIEATLQRLRGLAIELKIITGDNQLIAQTIGKHMGLANPRILTGPEVRRISSEALPRRVGEVDIFAEVEPNQKERIIIALKKSGNVVGYLGDGINDASALHAADVGISVDSAVDVAKESADIVLMEHDLGVLVEGVREGRVTFGNTLKYIFMATSANFGNMFSMAGASLFLPFLPLLPKQILLTNLLTDLPEMTIAGDRVEHEWLERPRRWNIRFIRNFMLVFGSVSSIFDYATFGILLLVLHANEQLFHTGWFVESVISASLVVLVIRTRRPFWRSRPSWPLLVATLSVILGVSALPYTPLGSLFGFIPIPPLLLGWIAGIVLIYVLFAEIAKWAFYRYLEHP